MSHPPIALAGVGVWTALWPPASRDMRQFWMCGAAMLICLLLMKERLFTIAAMFMFVAGQAGWRFNFARDAATQRTAFEIIVIALFFTLNIAVLITWLKGGAKLYGDPPTRFDWALTGTLAVAAAGCLMVIVLRTAQWYLAAYRR